MKNDKRYRVFNGERRLVDNFISVVDAGIIMAKNRGDFAKSK